MLILTVDFWPECLPQHRPAPAPTRCQHCPRSGPACHSPAPATANEPSPRPAAPPPRSTRSQPAARRSAKEVRRVCRRLHPSRARLRWRGREGREEGAAPARRSPSQPAHTEPRQPANTASPQRPQTCAASRPPDKLHPLTVCQFCRRRFNSAFGEKTEPAPILPRIYSPIDCQARRPLALHDRGGAPYIFNFPDYLR